MLKVDKNGVIYRPNGTPMGEPKKSGKIYRSANITGTINPETGQVYNNKGELLGEVDMSKIKVEFVIKSKSQDDSKKTKIQKAEKPEIKKVKTGKEDEKDGENEHNKYNIKKDNYAPGRDSFMVVTGRIGRICWPQKYDVEKSDVFVRLNKSRGWNYSNWIQLSAREDLDDASLVKYVKYIDWYTFTHFHPEHVIPDSIRGYVEKNI